MKQIYSTGPATEFAPASLRAQSPGAAAANVDAALSAAHYRAPEHPNGAAPVRLALLNSPGGRVLTHVTPAPGGQYFAHTILDVPATADAQLAIQTWGSPLWQTRAPESTADLPDLPYLPVADVLDDATLRDWLSSPARRDVLEFVLAALLGTEPHERVIVAASAADVATVVYAVTRALPPGLLDEFTFSTYEADPLTCPARLVGHDPGEGNDLPEACYRGAGVAVNPATGRKSELPVSVPFAAFAADRLAAGDGAAIDELKATWQRFNLKEPRQFDLVTRLARGTGVLTKSEAAEALAYPPLAAWVSARADALKQFLDWALEDRAFAAQSFPRAAQALRQKPDVLSRIAATARDAGLAALAAGDFDRAQTALEVVLPTVAPGKANGVWAEVLNKFPDPSTLPWPARQYLLPRLVRFHARQAGLGDPAAVAPSLEPWLKATPDKLGDLLALDLPRAYHRAAARATLASDGEPTAGTARTLAAFPTLTLELLQPAPGADPGKLFRSLLAEAPAHPWLEDVLARAADLPAATLNEFFEVALAAGVVDADRVIRTQAPRLLSLFAGQSGLDKLGTQLLHDPPADLLRATPLLDFLTQLQSEPQLTPALAARITAVRTVRAYLDAPTFAPEALADTARALAVTPPAVPATAKTETFAAVAATLYKLADRAGLQADLEATLVHFGPVLAAGPVDLYENLLRELRTCTDFARHPNLVPTFLAVALGATQSPELADKLDGLDGHAFAVARDAAYRGGKRLLAEVDRRSADWPRAAQTQWGFLRAAVKPRGFGSRARDAALMFSGAAAASLVWAAWALLVR